MIMCLNFWLFVVWDIELKFWNFKIWVLLLLYLNYSLGCFSFCSTLKYLLYLPFSTLKVVISLLLLFFHFYFININLIKYDKIPSTNHTLDLMDAKFFHLRWNKAWTGDPNSNPSLHSLLNSSLSFTTN